MRIANPRVIWSGITNPDQRENPRVIWSGITNPDQRDTILVEATPLIGFIKSTNV